MGSSGEQTASWFRTAFKFGVFTLRYRPWRRQLMFYVTLACLLQILIGVFPLDDLLSESLLLFAGYWGFCLLLVVTMTLLAIYDLLAVKGEENEKILKLRKALVDEANRAGGQHQGSKDR